MGHTGKRARRRVHVSESPFESVPNSSNTSEQQHLLPAEMQNAAGLPPEMRRPVSACSVAMVYTADATAYARATDRRAYAGSQRRLVAARDIAPGEVVLAEAPSLRWVDSSCARTVCGWCMRCVEGDPAGGKLQRCAGACAGRVRWCSAECAAAHRPTHAPVCVLIGHAMPGGALQRRGATRVISDCHFRKTATEYDRKTGIKWLSFTEK
jgi:hypothetical protein